MAKTPKTPWPHGFPTIVCKTCSGSGLSKAKVDSFTAGRRVSMAGTMAACVECGGRGKIIDDPGSIKCKHLLQTKDCYICRERRA